MPLALLAVALFQAVTPLASLDLRVDDAWRPWRAFVMDGPADLDPLLARVIQWRDSAPGVRVGDFEV